MTHYIFPFFVTHVQKKEVNKFCLIRELGDQFIHRVQMESSVKSMAAVSKPSEFRTFE